jgi:hypothetical protein
MKLSQDELLQIMSDVTTMLGNILTQHIELSESIADKGVELQTAKLDSMRAKIAKEKFKLAKMKRVVKRKRE